MLIPWQTNIDECSWWTTTHLTGTISVPAMLLSHSSWISLRTILYPAVLFFCRPASVDRHGLHLVRQMKAGHSTRLPSQLGRDYDYWYNWRVPYNPRRNSILSSSQNHRHFKIDMVPPLPDSSCAWGAGAASRAWRSAIVPFPVDFWSLFQKNHLWNCTLLSAAKLNKGWFWLIFVSHRLHPIIIVCHGAQRVQQFLFFSSVLEQHFIEIF